MKFIQNKLTNLYLLIKQQKNPYQIVKEKEMVYLHTVVQTLANGWQNCIHQHKIENPKC